jgi:GT2 family glycosyltransferase
MNYADVTVATPHIPVRSGDMLGTSAASAMNQTLKPRWHRVEIDEDHTGSAATRNRLLAKVTTEWVLWLDDDDMLMPNAVQLLVEAQKRTGADVVSGAAWIPQTADHGEPVRTPTPGWIPPDFVQERSRLHVSSLMRAELVRQVGGFESRADPGTGMELDDYGLYWKLAEHGATFYRIPETVLIWNVHGANTSGRGDGW